MAKVQPQVFDYHHPDWNKFVNELLNLCPVNSPEKAAQYREVYERYNGVSLVVPAE